MSCSIRRRAAAPTVLALLASVVVVVGEPVTVLYRESDARRPLVLRAPGGAILARGELTQAVSGARVTTRVVLHFTDGSLHDETVVFSQEKQFRLITDRLVQRGPAFPRAIDMSIDAAAGEVRVQAAERQGEPGQHVERLATPPDLANGMIPTLLKNVRPDAPPTSFSLIVATPKPRLVRLAIVSKGREPGRAAAAEAALHYVLKVEIGGIAGTLAPLVGKQPPDSHVWIREGKPPEYVASEQPFYLGGALWRMEPQVSAGAESRPCP